MVRVRVLAGFIVVSVFLGKSTLYSHSASTIYVPWGEPYLTESLAGEQPAIHILEEWSSNVPSLFMLQKLGQTVVKSQKLWGNWT